MHESFNFSVNFAPINSNKFDAPDTLVITVKSTGLPFMQLVTERTSASGKIPADIPRDVLRMANPSVAIVLKAFSNLLRHRQQSSSEDPPSSEIRSSPSNLQHRIYLLGARTSLTPNVFRMDSAVFGPTAAHSKYCGHCRFIEVIQWAVAATAFLLMKITIRRPQSELTMRSISDFSATN